MKIFHLLVRILPYCKKRKSQALFEKAGLHNLIAGTSVGLQGKNKLAGFPIQSRCYCASLMKISSIQKQDQLKMQ